jgi:SAM-dependent methyltransferase
MALRALSATGVLNGDTEVLGIAAGNESTVFVLTNYVRRVFATDLYLAPGWEESATASMMTHPGQHWSGPWRPGRLVVQNMNALDLWYEDVSIDAIFSSSSIEHFGDYEAVETSIREMFRVLKPGGICTLSTEFRLDGPSPGLPSTLIFSADELRRHVLEAAPWQLIDEVDLTAPSIESLMPVPFSKSTVEVRQHERKYGLMNFDQLEFSQWPQVALTHRGITWTSCHMVLRKPA